MICLNLNSHLWLLLAYWTQQLHAFTLDLVLGNAVTKLIKFVGLNVVTYASKVRNNTYIFNFQSVPYWWKGSSKCLSLEFFDSNCLLWESHAVMIKKYIYFQEWINFFRSWDLRSEYRISCPSFALWRIELQLGQYLYII